MSEPGSVAYAAFTAKLAELSKAVTGVKRVNEAFSSLPLSYQACWAAAEQAVRDASLMMEKPKSE